MAESSDTTKPVTSSSDKPGNGDMAGASYANAVLNFKQSSKDTNEEIIPEVTITTEEKEEKIATPPSGDIDDISFIPVASHSRRERKNERTKKDKRKQFHNSTDRNDRTQDKQLEKNSTKHEPQQKDHGESKDENGSNAKKVFVEAPLPKVNVWLRKSSNKSEPNNQQGGCSEGGPSQSSSTGKSRDKKNDKVSKS